jgi:signal transduction histidine kinase
MTQNHLSNLLLDQSKDLFWMINLDFQLIYANKSYQTIVKMVTGQEHKLYESAFVEDFGDISIEKWKTYYSRALKGEYFQVEEHFFHPELNDIQYSQITLEPLREDDKNIFAVACQSKKITYKEKQKSETIQMIDASLDVFCTNNEEKNLGYLNAATSKLYDYLPEELIGIANKELAFKNEEKEKRAAELSIVNKELAFQNEEKEKRAAELSIANKELAFQNEEKEKRAAELVIANKELIFQNDEKEKRAIEFGIANKELAFQNEEKEKRAAELSIANKELAFQNDEKEKRAIELGIANKELAFQNEEKEKRAAELDVLNKLLQQHTLELQRSNEELEQFAFVASHDLQEPLRMITSFMDILKRKYGDRLDEKGHQYIHFATDGAKRMRQIILDLLDYSRAGKLTEGKEIVDLNEVISKFKQLRIKLISEKNATVTSGNLPILNSYTAAITHILHSILDNALKYTKEGTSPIVEINAIENEKEWVFAIKDNGIGIDIEYYDKIFIIFQRLHLKEEYSGTGIGLSIAKRHVEILGGHIWLESEVGKGTVFYFTIPKKLKID